MKRRPADDARQGYRKQPIGSHFVFYRITDVGPIEVMRILHQRMDVAAHSSGLAAKEHRKRSRFRNHAGEVATPRKSAGARRVGASPSEQ